MSYDLAVFASRALDEGELRDLLAAAPALHAGPSGDGSLTVLRGDRGRYCFTLDGPEAIEAEDVPVEVSAVMLGASHLFTVMVEGTDEEQVPHAVRFAKRLAESLDGAVMDHQTGEVWSRSRSRTIQRPARQTRVSAIELNWFCLRSDVGDKPPRLFLETASRHLPEALPRRFGESEPLQGRYTDGGAEEFVRFWRAAASTVFFAGTGVCIGGDMDAGPADEFTDRFWSMSLTLQAEPLRSSTWRDAVRRLFIELADGLPAFYASATMTRDHIWSGRSLWADGRTEVAMHPLSRTEGWMGLPPQPSWWTWLGQPYREAATHLPPRQVTPTRAGHLLQTTAEPTGADGLEPLTDRLPPELFATRNPHPELGRSVPLERALSIPKALR